MEDGQKRRSSTWTLAVQGSSAVQQDCAGSRFRSRGLGARAPGLLCRPWTGPCAELITGGGGKGPFHIGGLSVTFANVSDAGRRLPAVLARCVCVMRCGECGLSSPPQIPQNVCASVPLPLRNLTGRKKRDEENKYWKYIVLQISV